MYISFLHLKFPFHYKLYFTVRLPVFIEVHIIALFALQW